MSLHSDDHLTDRDRLGRETDRDATLVAHAEQLSVRTERVARGRVVLRKRIVEEEQTVTVVVRREELEVVEEDLDVAAGSGLAGGDDALRVDDADRGVAGADGLDAAVDDDGALRDDDVEVVLYAERPVVTMEVVPVERVVVRRNVVREERTVVTDVSREEIVVEGDELARDGVARDGLARDGLARDDSGEAPFLK